MMDAQGQLGFRYIQVGQVSSYYFIRLEEGTGPRGRCGPGLCHCCPVPWMGTAGCHLPGQHRDTGGLSLVPALPCCPRRCRLPSRAHRQALPALPFSTEPVPGKSSPRSPPVPAASEPSAALPRSAPVLPVGSRSAQELPAGTNHRSCRGGAACAGTCGCQPHSSGTCPAHPG